MQNISINFQVPQGWHELGDKQLRYVYQLFAENFSADEVKTLCLLQWSDTKVIGKQPSGAYLLRKGKTLFEATPLTIAELLPALDWLASLPNVPVRMSKINRRTALTADFSEVPLNSYFSQQSNKKEVNRPLFIFCFVRWFLFGSQSRHNRLYLLNISVVTF